MKRTFELQDRLGCRMGFRAALALVAVTSLSLGACTGSAVSSVTSALSSAVQNASVASGLLACAPTAEQTAACDGLAAGDACSLTAPDGSASDGTCRATIDGSAVGCSPNPKAPPQEAIDACAGKADGDACSLPDRDGDGDGDGDGLAGVCGLARDGVTVACHRAFTPPQAAIDACAGKAKGDACALTGRNGESLAGTCGLGPHGDGAVLGCGPAGRLADAAAACAGLAAGDACTLSAGRHSASGSCVADAEGAVLCVVACGQVGHPFDGRCGGHRGGGR